MRYCPFLHLKTCFSAGSQQERNKLEGFSNSNYSLPPRVNFLQRIIEGKEENNTECELLLLQISSMRKIKRLCVSSLQNPRRGCVFLWAGCLDSV